MSVELVHVYRGGAVESIHRGDVVAVDQSGRIVLQFGDPHKRTFWRSSAKPFQIIPFIEAGGLERFDIQPFELALMCASHNGEVKHVQAVEGLLAKMGQTSQALDCGTSRPMYEASYQHLLKENAPFTADHNPCSGKHSGMIGLGLLKNYDLKDYIDVNHPIQKEMLNVVSAYTQMPKEAIDIAIDGCGVPVFGLPLYQMATAYAKLTTDDPLLQKISHAMMDHAYYVAGTGRLDTVLMEETKGKIVAKLGAESVYCIGVMDKGIGFAMKTEDGAYRALDRFVPDVLLKQAWITQDEHTRIMARIETKVYNHRKQVVGHYASVL